MASLSPDPFDLLLVSGVAEYLEAADVVAWDELGDGTAYDSDTDWPTFIGPRMPTSPDAIVVITPTTRSHVRADVLQAFQIRLRGSALSEDTEPDPAEISRQHEAILAVLYPNGFPIVHVTLGSLRAGIVKYLGSSPAETDASGRLGMMMNFQARVRRPRLR